MPILYRYDPRRELLIHIGDGPVSLDDIAELREARRRDGVPAMVPHTLTDMRRARFTFDIPALKAHESGRSETEYAGYRHAELVTDPEMTAVLMIWRKWLPRGVLVEIFSTPEAAYEWLGVPRHDGDLEL